MNMPDIRKTNRSVHIWTEDVIKFNRIHKGYVGGISAYLRDVLHNEFASVALNPREKDELARRIDRTSRMRDRNKSAAKERNKPVDRFSENASAPAPAAKKTVRTLTTDVVDIPPAVRKNPKFVTQTKTAKSRKSGK